MSRSPGSEKEPVETTDAEDGMLMTGLTGDIWVGTGVLSMLRLVLVIL